MRLIFSALLITLMLAVPVVSHAQTNREPNPPEVLNNFVRQGGQLFFLGEYEGMNGWVLIREGQPEYFYENPERTALVMGLLFDKDGQMVTMPQLSRLHDRVGDDMYATTGKLELSQDNTDTDAADVDAAQAETPAPTANQAANTPALTENAPDQTTSQAAQQGDTSSGLAATDFASSLFGAQLSSAEKMFVDLIRSNWVTMNPEGSHDMFAFIDPNCSHCKQLIRDADSFLQKGDLRLRIIPVGMNADSARRAAVLLASANPVERLKRFAEGDEGALPAPANINTEAVQDNTALMVRYNFDVTPLVAYRTKGEEIRLIRGRPTDYDNLIRDINEN